ncbi:MAG: hypothetical protein ACSLE6_16150 [Mycobacterium sp.]
MSGIRDVADAPLGLVIVAHPNPTVVPEVVQLVPRVTKKRTSQS